MPATLDTFKKDFPEAWSAYEKMRDACDRSGPLDAKTVELIKIGISVAMEHTGGLVAHMSQARKAGAQVGEIHQAILLATGLAGFPAVLAAMAAAQKYLKP